MVMLTKDGRPAAGGPLPQAGNGSKAQPVAAPVFERVREDPPARTGRPGRVGVADKILPILDDIVRAEGTGAAVWWRVGLFPKKGQASSARGAVVKRLGAAGAARWEFKSAPVPPPGPGASALYARRKVGR